YRAVRLDVLPSTPGARILRADRSRDWVVARHNAADLWLPAFPRTHRYYRRRQSGTWKVRRCRDARKDRRRCVHKRIPARWYRQETHIDWWSATWPDGVHDGDERRAPPAGRRYRLASPEWLRGA